jgi:hypothetical protein
MSLLSQKLNMLNFSQILNNFVRFGHGCFHQIQSKCESVSDYTCSEFPSSLALTLAHLAKPLQT